MRVPCIVVLCISILPATGRPALAEFDSPTAIINARIVLDPTKSIETGTVVIDNGRIVAVGPNVPIPPNAEVLDAIGLIVYPGFLDTNTHAGIIRDEPSAEQRALLEDESPDVRDGPHSATLAAYRRLMHPHWQAETIYDPAKAEPDAFRKAGFTTALVSPKVAIFAGQSALIQLGDAPLRRAILKTRVAQHAAFVRSGEGDEFTRERPRYPVTTMGAVAAFRQILLDARWHHDLTEWWKRNPAKDAPAFDRDLDTLRPVLNGKQPVVLLANHENEIHRALDLAKEFDLRPILAGGREAWKAIDRLKRENVPVILSLKWSEEPEAEAKKKREKRKKDSERSEPSHALDPIFDAPWENQPWEPLQLLDERQRLWAEQVDNAKRLHEAGVTFAFGSFELASSEKLLKNLRKAVERGLPEEAALAGLTTNAAAILGLENRIGSIAPGKLANLAILTKPWAEEKARTRWVFVSGKRFDIGAGTDEKKDGEKKEKKAEDENEKPASKPTSQSTTTQATPPAPNFAVEIEADRTPTFMTDGNVLLRNAALLPITKNEMPETDLLIRDGKIARIGKNLTAPDNIATIDLTGYTIMPGIIDPHSHICIDGGLNEYSVSVSCEVRLRDVINPHDVAAYRALAGGTTTIHTMHGSANAMGGQNVVLRLKYGQPADQWIFRQAPRTVKFALGENVKQSNWGKKKTRFPNTRMGVEAVMRRSFDAARDYEKHRRSYQDAKRNGKNPKPIRTDLRLAALTDIHDGNIRVHTHCYRADEILRLISVAEDQGFRIAVLQHVLEGYRVIPEIRRHGCGTSTFSDWWAYKIEAYQAIPHNAARMLQGGVLTTINSDSPDLIRHLNLEAAKSLRYGRLSPNDALRLITLHGAMQLGITDLVGSLDVGKLADLAVFDGHPLDTHAKCVLTLIDGQTYFQHPTLDVKQPQRPRARKTFAPAAMPRKVRSARNGIYCIRGATIHPINGPPIENGVLILADGKIEKIGRADGSPLPPLATVLDATGLHVYPGLINAGTQLGITEIRSVAGTVDAADIGKFQPDLRALSAYDPFASAIEVTRSEGVTSALIVPTGPLVAGQAGFVHLDGWSMPEAKIETAVGLIVDLPSLPVRFPDDLEEKKRKERIKEHREKLAELETFFRTARHYADVSTKAEQNADLTPEFDRKLAAMIPYMRRQKPVLFIANTYKQIREAIHFADRYELLPVLYGGREAWKLADALAEKNVDVILTGTMMVPGSKFEPWDSVYRNAAVLAEAGVRFCFATNGTSLAKNLGVEAGMAVAHGLDPDRALQALTLDAARILGVDDRLGSLEVGKIADVIVTTDTPTQASSSVVFSFIAGQPVDLTNKHIRTDAKFRARPKPNLPPPVELRGPPPTRLPIHKNASNAPKQSVSGE